MQEAASDAAISRARAPITTASSPSKSTRAETRGSRISSSGPITADGAFRKSAGCSGVDVVPRSAACDG